MIFNKKEYIAKVQPAADKLITHFQNKGITFSSSDGDLENVVFSSKDKEVKISHHSFYRYSGIACVYKERGENFIEAIEVTNEMFMNNFMKPIIELHFKEE